ncbi:class I SAM-dependent methyltransferase [Streptomyces tubbatahanensis]|uniref:Class I SAM-dependent methyltransferase n=1 Tax=Streptomyces tubbatahanensis TaxID=2923272 RepID=A0ABY3XXM7_9ACTN|nr:class I SAM-dependent methyltransferase [Streptomyces tubbatahanensis]UNS99096.1 class I SAM-dependent methyltransferase [Streptomyces tubbatahanensis]
MSAGSARRGEAPAFRDETSAGRGEPPAVREAEQRTLLGQEVYSDRVLRIYDPLVLLATNSLVWRCPRREMLGLYRRYATSRHLEVGVGTGYFLDRCRFPGPVAPRLTLLDLNSHTLEYASRRLARLSPEVRRANVLEPLPVPDGSYDSAGLNMVLHCLPGSSLREKEPALAHVARAVRPGGTVFGSTILAHGVRQSRAARAVLRNHNERGILQNTGDSLEDLQTVLERNFEGVTVRTRGSFALFTATAAGSAKPDQAAETDEVAEPGEAAGPGEGARERRAG